MTNPLLQDWTPPFALPPFADIEDAHFGPALDQALEEGRAAIRAIADTPEPPTFANTIEALERADRLLDRVAGVFYNLAGADATPYLLCALVLAAIDDGMERQRDPGPPLVGNASEDPEPKVPTDWAGALDCFESSAFVLEYFGSEFRRLYATTRRGEMIDFNSHVSPLEHAWYLRPS